MSGIIEAQAGRFMFRMSIPLLLPLQDALGHVLAAKICVFF